MTRRYNSLTAGLDMVRKTMGQLEIAAIRTPRPERMPPGNSSHPTDLPVRFGKKLEAPRRMEMVQAMPLCPTRHHPQERDLYAPMREE